MNPARKRLMAYLASYGIRGDHIRADSIGPDGYNRIDFPDEPEYRIAWPDDFQYDWLVALMDVARMEDFRLAGVDRSHVIQ